MANTTKLKFALLIGAIILMLSGCTIVVTSSQQWTLYYTWNGDVQGKAVWTLYTDGTFQDNSGGSGQWSVQGSLFQLQYDSGSLFYSGTIYTGTVYSSSYIAGNMTGEDVYHITHTGTWYAYLGLRASKNLSPDPLPSRTPSGEPLSP